MKLHLPKVLFAAVVAACSAAYGIDITTTGAYTIAPGDGAAYTSETLGGVQLIATNDKSTAIPTIGAATATALLKDGQGRFLLKNADALASAGTLIMASGNYNKDAAGATPENAYTAGQLFIDASGAGAAITLNNNLVIGANGYQEVSWGNNYGGALRLSSNANKVTLAGTVTMVDNASITVAGENTITGNVSGAGKTLTVQTGGTLILAGESNTLGGLIMESAVAKLGNGTTTLAGLTLGAGKTLVNDGTLNLSGTVNLTGNTGATSTIRTEGNGYGDMVIDRQIISGTGTTTAAGDIVYQINGQTVSGLALNTENGKLQGTAEGVGTIYAVNTDTTFNKDNNSVLNNSTGLVVRNNATLTISGKTGNSNGVIRGEVVVEDGSKLVLQANDALGWSGNNVTKLTLNGNASVEMTHNSNETFAGQLILNGTSSITGANASWDVYESGSSVTVGANANVEINTKKLNFRRDDATFTVGDNATLTIAAEMTKGDRGNKVLILDNGNANTSVKLNGGGDIGGLLIGGGKVNVNKDLTIGRLMLSKTNKHTTLTIATGTTLNVTGNVTADNGTGSFELCNWGQSNVVNLNGTLIANAGISMEGNGAPVVNIENGGVLTMNAGLWGVKREGNPKSAAVINVKSGGLLQAATDTANGDTDAAKTAQRNLVSVTLNDGSKMEGLYGEGTTAVINQSLNLQNDATVTMLTTADKEFIINGALSNASGSVIAQGGGTLTLANTAELAGLTAQADTTVKLTGSATALGSLTIGDGAQINNSGALTVSGTTAITAADTLLTTVEHTLATGNGYGTNTNTVAMNNFITGEGSTTLGDLTVNGNAATYDATSGVITFEAVSKLYYINDSSAAVEISGNAVMAGQTFTQNKYIGIGSGKSLTISGSDAVLNANGQGFWIDGGTLTVENGATLNLRANENDALVITNAEITSNGNSNFGNNGGNNNTFYANVQVDGDATAKGGLVKAYSFTGGTLTIDSEQNTAVNSTTLNDVVVTADSDVTFTGYTNSAQNFQGTVSLNSLSAANSAVTVAEGVSLNIAATTTTVESLTLGSGSAITLAEHEGELAVTSSMAVSGAVVVNADLVIAAGATLNFTNSATVTLGCEVSFGAGTTITLDDSYASTLISDGRVLLFTDVETLDLATLSNVTVTGNFTDGMLIAETYDVGGVTKYNIYATPEPATATLSLLALAGLCARRRRH